MPSEQIWRPENAKETKSLKPETEEAIQKLYRPTGPKPKPKSRFGKIIIEENPEESAWLTQRDLEQAERDIQEDLEEIKKEEKLKALARQGVNRKRATH